MGSHATEAACVTVTAERRVTVNGLIPAVVRVTVAAEGRGDHEGFRRDGHCGAARDGHYCCLRDGHYCCSGLRDGEPERERER